MMYGETKVARGSEMTNEFAEVIPKWFHV